MTTSLPFEPVDLRDVEAGESVRTMARSARRSNWKQWYRRRIVLVDVASVVYAVASANGVTVALDTHGYPTSVGILAPVAASLLTIAALLSSLALCRSRDVSLIYTGVEEYRRVAMATASAFAFGALMLLAGPALGLGSQVRDLIESHIVGIFLPTAFLAALTTLLAGRYTVRRAVRRRLAAGDGAARIVVLGKQESAVQFCDTVARSGAGAYDVVGVCIPDFHGELGAVVETALGALPVLSDVDSIELALRVTGADAVVVTSAEELGPTQMKTLEWTLDSLDVEMLVVPGMMDTACQRITLRHIDNVPLLHVNRPNFGGTSAFAKRAFDLTFSLLALVAALPIMVVTTIAIKLDDGGPVIFRQTRVGRHGNEFRIFKFRTMTVDADSRKEAERAASADCGEVFFKSANDSRVTRVGRLLRATSLDELPQLFNVIAGSMSIVGPRPLVPGEGSSVEHFLARRSLMKPGMTGLWQVSGRSDVSDAERVRLDHSYVDNWSNSADMLIVAGTARAVLQRKGAY